MRIQQHDLWGSRQLQSKLEELGLIYSASSKYSSLLAPASVHVSPIELTNLQVDLTALASFYATWNKLYLSSLRSEAPSWISALVESGLTPAQCIAHRLIAEAKLEPMMMRVDYVEISANFRQIAEVQWKSGGPGFFYGHTTAFQQVFPMDDGVAMLGDITAEYFNTLQRLTQHVDSVVVNELRKEWLPGEAYLHKEAQARHMHYYAVDRATLSRSLRIGTHEITLDVDDSKYPVTVLRGRGFTDVLTNASLIDLAQASVEGRIWIETPMNFLYRQKWGFALPFLQNFCDLFDSRITEILIPAALVVGEHIDLLPIVKNIPDQHRDRIADTKSLSDLPKLPEASRKQLVLKCGSGTGAFHNRGRGVFRLNGSSGTANKVVELVRHRVLQEREPWIIQPFVSCKYNVPIAPPSISALAESQKVHARILVFGGKDRAMTWKVQGGIGNFGKHWKVSGSSARESRPGEFIGTAFTDVRLETPPTMSLES